MDRAELLRAAGWSPSSLEAAVSPDKENAPPSRGAAVTNYLSQMLNFQSVSFLSPSVKGSAKARVGKADNREDESPMRSLAKSFGLHSLIPGATTSAACSSSSSGAVDPDVVDLYAESPSSATPIAQTRDVKHTPSPSRFIDLTIGGADEEWVKPKKASFQSAKTLLQFSLSSSTATTMESSVSHKEDIAVDFSELNDPLPNGWTLFQHQKDAVVDAVKNRRSILAYDMGLGKTMICLKWAKIFCSQHTGCIAVLLCPCTLVETWRREAEVVGFRSSTDIDAAAIAREADKGMLLLIASWSKIPSLAALLARGRTYVVIGDESHAMQSLSSIRTQGALALCGHEACIGCVLATGTPMKNGRPSNLLPLLIAIRHPIARNRIEFEKRYCNARRTAFCAWDTSGATNLEELRVKVGSFLLRKTKEECLDLPPLVRTKHEVAVSRECATEYADILRQMKGRAVGKPLSGGLGGNALELLSAMRELVSRAKVEPLSLYICDLLADDPSPLVVFVNFRESAFSLQRLLSAKCVRGGDKLIISEHLTGDIVKQSDRQRRVDDFQSGKLDVLVCTFGVGSVGLTLTRSHRVILMDRPWTPGDLMQAEDRIRRIGQKHSEVGSYWITAFDFDTKLDKVLESKDGRSHAVLSSGAKQTWFTKLGAPDSKGGASVLTAVGSKWNLEHCGEDSEGASSSIMKDLLKKLTGATK